MRCLVLAAILLLLVNSVVFASDHFEIVDVKIEGAERTDADWILQFLQLRTPASLNQVDCQSLERKLMTTGVFASVNYELIESETHAGGHVLVFKLREKWTTIPVIRGAMGGGTPLRVFGIYDTHVFGRLWTLGFETRKYGTAPNGYIGWIRAPRWRDGRSYLSLEAWNLPRVRNLYDKEDNIVGNLNTDTRFLRFEHLRPIDRLDKITRRGNWKYGLRLDLQRTKQDTFTNLSSGFSMPPILVTNQETNELHLLPKIQYDNILQSNLELDGIKFTTGTGFILDDSKYTNISEFEIFYFHPFWKQLYSAFHFRLDSTDSLRSSQIHYLGGLDSIRGHPDGVLYGPHSAYANLELRMPTYIGKKVHMQNVVFYDSGSAGFEWNDLSGNRRSSVGFGIRIGSPFIYRLVLRIDYAWSLDSANQGLSIGLNQFFQPYKPL